MKAHYEQGTLVLSPAGRIDSNNAAAIEKEIFDEIEKYSTGSETEGVKHIVIDAGELEYISSAGLRVVLKVKKAYDSTQIINASSELYEIFDMTGFTDILDVKKTFREVTVDESQKIGEGGVGITYRLDEDTIVKLYKPGFSFDDIIRERESARAAFTSGVPTAIPFDTVKCGDMYGTVYEMINARPLCQVLNESPDNIEIYAKKTVELLKLLADTHAPEGKFYSFKEVSHDNVDAIDRYIEGEHLFTEQELALSHKFFYAIPDRDTLIHGDMHAKNIFVQDGELILIDMADTCMGHPIFEFGNMYTAVYLGKTRGDEESVRLLGIDHKTASDFFDQIVKYYFPHFDQSDIADLTGLLQILYYYRILRGVSARAEFLPKEMADKMINGLTNALTGQFFNRPEEVFAALERVLEKW